MGVSIQLFAIIHKGIGIESLGICRITTFLRARGIDVNLVYLYGDQDVDNEFKKVNCNNTFFGFSLLQGYTEFTMGIIERIKKKNRDSIVFLGSKFVTAAANHFLRCFPIIDFVVLGHGEYPICALLTEYEKNGDLDTVIKNHPNIMSAKYCHNKKECYTEITELPWPDRQLISENKGILVAYLAFSHGCTANCTFCKVWGRWSGKSAQEMLDEINDIYSKTGVHIFFIVDGSFEDPGKLGKERIKEFCNLLIKNPVKFSFRCHLRAESFEDNQEDKDLLIIMHKAGFYDIIFGSEAGNQEDLNDYRKKATVEDNIKMYKLLKEVDIYPNYGFIMLNPYSDAERLKRNYQFLVDLECQDATNYVRLIEIYYDTEIYKRLKSDKLLLQEDQFLDKMMYNYKCRDSFAQSVFEFINTYFPSDGDIITMQTAYCNNLSIYYAIRNDLINRLQFDAAYYDIKNRMFLVCKEYFYHLYIDNNIKTCCDLFDDFRKNLISLNGEFQKFYYQAMKEYLKENRMRDDLTQY